MTFELNGVSHPLSSGLTVVRMLQVAGYGVAGHDPHAEDEGELIRPGIALAINESVIPRSLWASVVIQSGDRVDLFTAIAGG